MSGQTDNIRVCSCNKAPLRVLVQKPRRSPATPPPPPPRTIKQKTVAQKQSGRTTIDHCTQTAFFQIFVVHVASSVSSSSTSSSVVLLRRRVVILRVILSHPHLICISHNLNFALLLLLLHVQSVVATWTSYSSPSCNPSPSHKNNNWRHGRKKL